MKVKFWGGVPTLISLKYNPFHVVLEQHDVALILRAEGAGYAAAEEDVLLCLLATGEARGVVAVQVDRKATRPTRKVTVRP